MPGEVPLKFAVNAPDFEDMNHVTSHETRSFIELQTIPGKHGANSMTSCHIYVLGAPPPSNQSAKLRCVASMSQPSRTCLATRMIPVKLIDSTAGNQGRFWPVPTVWDFLGRIHSCTQHQNQCARPHLTWGGILNCTSTSGVE